MEAAGSTEILVTVYWRTCHHIPEDQNLHENLESHNIPPTLFEICEMNDEDVDQLELSEQFPVS